MHKQGNGTYLWPFLCVPVGSKVGGLSWWITRAYRELLHRPRGMRPNVSVDLGWVLAAHKLAWV